MIIMKENKKYNILLTVLTPMSIGAGAESDWAKGVDYVLSGNKVYVLDLKKVVKAGVDISKISDCFLKGDNKGILLLLGNKLSSVSKYCFESPAFSDNPIKTFLRSKLLNVPIVAGSSLKGAISSILFAHLRRDENRPEDVLGKMNNSLMRFVKVTDFELNETSLVNTKIFNLQQDNREWIGGWKHGAKDGTDSFFKTTGFNTIYECAMPSQKALGSILISPNFDCVPAENAMYAEEKKNILNNDLPYLFSIINEHTRLYLEKERDFFEEYHTDKSDYIIDSIDNLLSLIPDDGTSCILKMSAGAGFHSITGDFQFDDYTGGLLDRKSHRGDKSAKPKSRKIAVWGNEFALMGFVKLSIISDKEYAELSENLAQKHADYFASTLAVFEEQRLAEEKRLAEIQARKDAEKAAEEERIRKEEEAKLAAVEKAKQIETFIQQEAAAAVAKNKMPLADRLQGIASIGNLAGTLKKWNEANEKCFAEKELEITVEYIRLMNVKNIAKDMKNKRKEFIKAIGEDWTNKLLKELCL